LKFRPGHAMLWRMGDHAHLEQRIDELSARADAGREPGLLAEMEDLLSEGYARALADESLLRQLDRRLDALFENVNPADATEIRRLASERRRIAERVQRLRQGLARMQEGFLARQRQVTLD
jgi:hypothetical protein